jgi:tetratricopeptide (TPR) repeat protein
MSRVDMLLGFIAQSPQDPFPRYALALEYRNAGRLDDARAAFAALMDAHPDYTAAYLHAGNTLVTLGDRGAARETYRRGIEACIRRADHHAQGELEGALAALGADSAGG